MYDDKENSYLQIIARVRLENDELKERVAELEAANAKLTDLISTQSKEKVYPENMMGVPVTASVSEYNYDMSKAPLGGKLIALSPGKTACFAVLTRENRKYFEAWAPLPKQRKRK